MNNRLYIIILLLPFLGACSLKENRSDCPCWLNLDLSQPFSCGDNINCLLMNQNNVIIMDKSFSLQDGSITEQTVPRGVHTLIGLVDYCDSERTGILTFKNNQPIDTLWSHRGTIDCQGEFAKERVVVHRHFARMKIINKTHIVGQTNLSSIQLVTTCGGLSLFSLEPIVGDWHIGLPITPNGESTVIIPRLTSQMKLNLILTDNNGNTVEYDLQKNLQSQGYNWNDCCLRDVIVGVDYITSGITITVVPWQNGSHYEEII